MATQQPADGKDSELITLALNTLGGFDFTSNLILFDLSNLQAMF
jgi:hypothetical protein